MNPPGMYCPIALLTAPRISVAPASHASRRSEVSNPVHSCSTSLNVSLQEKSERPFSSNSYLTTASGFEGFQD